MRKPSNGKSMCSGPFHHENDTCPDVFITITTPPYRPHPPRSSDQNFEISILFNIVKRSNTCGFFYKTFYSPWGRSCTLYWYRTYRYHAYRRYGHIVIGRTGISQVLGWGILVPGVFFDHSFSILPTFSMVSQYLKTNLSKTPQEMASDQIKSAPLELAWLETMYKMIQGKEDLERTRSPQNFWHPKYIFSVLNKLVDFVNY